MDMPSNKCPGLASGCVNEVAALFSRRVAAETPRLIALKETYKKGESEYRDQQDKLPLQVSARVEIADDIYRPYLSVIVTNQTTDGVSRIDAACSLFASSGSMTSLLPERPITISGNFPPEGSAGANVQAPWDFKDREPGYEAVKCRVLSFTKSSPEMARAAAKERDAGNARIAAWQNAVLDAADERDAQRKQDQVQRMQMLYATLAASAKPYCKALGKIVLENVAVVRQHQLAKGNPFDIVQRFYLDAKSNQCL